MRASLRPTTLAACTQVMLVMLVMPVMPACYDGSEGASAGMSTGSVTTEGPTTPTGGSDQTATDTSAASVTGDATSTPATATDATTNLTTDATTNLTTDATTDLTTGDPGPLVLDYPDKRVGIFYLAWHAYAWAAVSQVDPAQPRTVESVIRGDNLQFSDLFLDKGLNGTAAGFHWHQEPSLGFYSLYRPRDGEAPVVAPYPNTAGIAAAHAAALWDAGIDFVFLDITNVADVNPFSDAIGLRPFEVLLAEWGALRAQGIPTPQVAAWVPALDVADKPPMFRALLDAYDAAAPDLVLTHNGQRVLFLVDSTGSSSFAPHVEEIKSRGVLPVPMWGNMGADALAAGVAGWMQPCTSGGQFSTLLDAATICAQGYTTSSPLGTVVSASRSFQTGYASLPLQAAGRLGGLTFQKQFATALAVQPNYLLINAWNEHVAQPQPNPFTKDFGALGRSMGMTDAPDADPSADWLWVDMYGAEYNRDFEPTVEDGGAGYALLQSCLRVWRSGATSCNDGAEPCCQPAEPRVLVRSVRRTGGPTAGEHVPITDPAEASNLLMVNIWEEVCNLFYGQPGLCGGGPANSGDGPFRLHASGGAGRVPLYRCFTGADNFISTDAGCEGTTVIGLLGYSSVLQTTDSARPLNRCITQGKQPDVHLHWIDGPCPAGSSPEGPLGFVR